MSATAASPGNHNSTGPADTAVVRQASPFALELRHVTRAFGSHLAVDDVTMTVARGEFVTLLGPSGCGKTTILRMVAGFEQPTGGSILVGGTSVEGVPPYRRPIGIVFQNLALFPHMTVEGNIAFGLEVMGATQTEIRDRVGDALDLIGLAGLGGRRVHEISGGQRQRVALARALVTRPTVLLLDEPLGALDLKIRRQLQIELKRIQRQVGTTFVFVTHDQDEALTMSDRIAVINHGRVEQLATPGEIYNRPRTQFVARFIGDTNLLQGTVATCDGRRATIDLPEVGATVPVELGPEDIGIGDRVAVSIRPENVRIAVGVSGPDRPMLGQLEEAVYAGSHVRCRLRVKAAEIIANVPVAPSRAAQPIAGQVYAIDWNPADCVVQVLQ